MTPDVLAALFDVLDNSMLPPLISRQSAFSEEDWPRALVVSVVRGVTLPQAVLVGIGDHMRAKMGVQRLSDAVSQFSFLYGAFYDILSPFAIRPTIIYSSVPEFSVVATATLAKDNIIQGLLGVLVPLDDSTLLQSPGVKRSMIEVGKTKKSMRLMGPLSRVNHDCDDFSAEFYLDRKLDGFQLLGIRSIRQILRGEEVTVRYSGDYFGVMNEDCLCASCESKVRNGWSASGAVVTFIREKTRHASVVSRQNSLRDTIYTYDEIPALVHPRIPKDYSNTLQSLPSIRCIALHCRMLFVNLTPGSFCACCTEQVRAIIAPRNPLERYYVAVLERNPLLGPYHTLTPLMEGSRYLATLSIEGWHVYPRIIRFNDRNHKARMVRDTISQKRDASDLNEGATCASAAAAGSRQSGHVYVLSNEWRPKRATNQVQFPRGDEQSYTCVLLLRDRKLFILDPCYEAISTRNEAKRSRITELSSMHRVRTMISAMTSGSRKCNISQGIFIGSWKALSCDDEFDLSSFACYEFLEAMQQQASLRGRPEQWAKEPVDK